MIQEKVVQKLEKKGFIWRYYSEEHDFTVLAKRLGADMTTQVEVDNKGLCNGKPLEEFLKILKKEK